MTPGSRHDASPPSRPARDRPAPDNDLVTAEELFGDIVDAPLAEARARGGRVGPIRVQVAEPAREEDAQSGMDAAGPADTDLGSRDVEALLDILSTPAAPPTPPVRHDETPVAVPRVRPEDLAPARPQVPEAAEAGPPPEPAAVAPTARARGRLPFGDATVGEFESLLDGMLAPATPAAAPAAQAPGRMPPPVASPAVAPVAAPAAAGADPPGTGRVPARVAVKAPKALDSDPLDLLRVALSAFEQGPPVARAPRRHGPLNYGPYRLLERIATGGMAEVFRAKYAGAEGFEKVVAVKRILAHLSGNKEFVDMFVDEAKMVAGLSHPNIVQIFDLGRLDTSYYIAMEYVHGRDLRSIQRRGAERGQRVPMDLSALVVGKVCLALEYAHRRKDDRGRPMQLVHRDVSPQNILISFEGDVKLTDFGIAKAASKATITDRGSLRGKLLYMSPEQASGQPIDRRSDIFALGIVLYELLTGERPFNADNERSILEAVRQCRVTPPRALNPRVPEKLEAVALRALTRDPEERYQDAGEMFRDLDRLLRERQAPSAAELARLLELLFDERERAEAGPEAASEEAGVDDHDIEFEAAPGADPVSPSAEVDALLKRRGIR